jgi:hypothetical protein
MQLQEQIRRIVELLGGSARRAASLPDIEAAERRLGVRFPDDVKLLISAFDGSDDATPLENGWVTFWPVAMWRRVSDDPIAIHSRLCDVILFSDHSLECWYYALDLARPQSGSPVYMITGLDDERLVASSLSGFLQAILDDAMILYRGYKPDAAGNSGI